uniref:Outer membrane protein A n=1 Tax=Haliea sp. ETY-M TaxID=1055105 RepID=A0A455R2W8_9GAMM|nr:outer membrane protein A precursor [Haliea sp. ETY-M]
MPFLVRLVVLASALTLAACTATTQREYERCIVGLGVLGGAVGATSSGAAVVAGGGAGLLASGVICKPPERAQTVMATEAADSDGDGVDDANDACPGTPPNTKVNRRGCPPPPDSDGDGVPDHRDDCPNTPAGTDVDTRGCPVPDTVVLTVDRLGFAFDSAALDAESRAALNSAVDVIKAHSGVMLDVVGYTDTSGPESYNQGLSERRAQAAVDYLVSKGVDRSQLRAVGRGEANPIASNDTRDGRSKNRRVELVVR